MLHHVKEPQAWLTKLASELKTGARLALIEFKEGELPEGPPRAMKIPRAELLKMVTAAGFRLLTDRPELLPYQMFFVFEKV